MKIALVQSEIQFENKRYNLSRATEFIRSAGESEAELVLFPEMSFTGFSMSTQLTGETDNYTIDLMRSAAKKFGIAIGFGYVMLRNGKAENRYAITDKTGLLVSDYVKIHSFAIGGEGSTFRSGTALPPPVSLSSHTISTFICYDLRFPEIFRAVCDDSSIMTVAANWPASRIEHWDALLKARAIENQSYIIGINCTGTQGDMIYNGHSAVIDPSGRVIAEAGSGENMLICDIDNDVAVQRSAFPALCSRKFELYRNFLLNIRPKCSIIE